MTFLLLLLIFEESGGAFGGAHPQEDIHRLRTEK
jgi:hypothetical protein